MQVQYGSWSDASNSGGSYGITYSHLDFYTPGGLTHFACGAFSGSNGLPANNTAFASEADWLSYASALETKSDEVSSQGLDCGIYDVRGSYIVVGGTGDDYVYADGRFPSSGFQHPPASSGDGQFWGRAGNDYIAGGTGADFISGGDGADSLAGGDGNDTVQPGMGNDTIDGGAGVNTLDLSDLTAGVSFVAGTNGTDILAGGSKTYSNFTNLIATDLDDTVYAGNGDGVIDGGGGVDLLSYNGFYNSVDQTGVTVSLTLQGTAQDTGVGSQTLSNFEALTGSFYDDHLTGDSNANSLSGSDGDDTIATGGGSDTVDGGAGVDTLDLSGLGSVGVVFAFGVDNTLTSGADVIHLAGIEHLLAGAGDDSIAAGASGIQIDGGDGADTLVAGSGTQTLIGGAGEDLVSYAAATAGVTVSLALSTAQSTGLGTQQLLGFEDVQGSSYGDRLTGSGGDNRIFGGDGADTITAATGYETIDGGAGADTLSFANIAGAIIMQPGFVQTFDGSLFDDVANIETLIGTAFNDYLTDSTGVHVLSGGGGDDMFAIGGATDTLTGGTGHDTANYTGATGAVTVNLKQGIGQVAGGGSQALIGIENITGSAGDDRLTGDANANYIFAGDGDDTVIATTGDDTIYGGLADSNTLSFASAGAGVTLRLNGGAQQTGLGLQTYIAFDHVIGSAFADNLSNAVEASGGAGDDTLSGTAYFGGGGGEVTLDGGAGRNTLSFSGFFGVTAKVAAGSYVQTVNQVVMHLSGFTDLAGSGGNDVLSGDDRANRLQGGDGSDTLIGGGGQDTLDGGGSPFADVVDFSAGKAVHVSLLTQGVLQDTGADTLMLIGIEGLIGSAKNDLLIGDAAANTLIGGAGADTLVSNGGADSLDGGDGFDIADLSGTGAAIYIQFASGLAYVDGGYINLSGIEGVIGAEYDDIVYDTAAAQSISAGGGNDTVYTLGGNDTFDGGAGIDQINYFGDPSGVTVDLSNRRVQDTGVGHQLIRGFENLQGTSYADVLSGRFGDDTLAGEGGGDTINGHGGNDVMSAGSGGTLTYAGAARGVSLDLGQYTVQNTGVGHQVISGFSTLVGSSHDDDLGGSNYADRLDGAGGADSLKGGDGADTLVGGSARDTMVGGAGADLMLSNGDGDLMTGGGGADTFSFTTLNSSTAATITDVSGLDKVDLRAAETALGLPFTHVAALDGHAGEFTLKYIAAKAQTEVRFDLDGDGKSDHVITLANGDQTGFHGFVL